MYCGTELVHIAHHLGDKYKIKIFPNITEDLVDQRKSKKSDYVIIRLVNEKTVMMADWRVQ
jgi:hypothetical protein